MNNLNIHYDYNGNRFRYGQEILQAGGGAGAAAAANPNGGAGAAPAAGAIPRGYIPGRAQGQAGGASPDAIPTGNRAFPGFLGMRTSSSWGGAAAHGFGGYGSVRYPTGGVPTGFPSCGSGSGRSSPPPAWTNTEIDWDYASFNWALANYSTLEGHSTLKSPVFKGGEKSKHSWQLKLTPRKVIEGQEYMSLGLTLVGFGESASGTSGTAQGEVKELNARFEVWLVNVDGHVVKQIEVNCYKFKKGCGWGIDKLITTYELYHPQNRLLIDERLRIRCLIWIDNGIKHSNESLHGSVIAGRKYSYYDQDLAKEKIRLCEDFRKIVQNPKFTDFTIMTADGTIKVHKAILAGRSSVFAALLHTDMCEVQTNKLEIIDFPLDVVRAMVNYVYTGETELVMDKPVELLQIAEKYDLQGLKKLAENILVEKLSVANAGQMLVYGNLLNAEELKERATQFIVKHKEDVVTTRGFHDASRAHPEFVAELFFN